MATQGIQMKRECGSCTKCCEGWLFTEINGQKLYPSNPCHFVSTGKGCTIYSTRPKDPCIDFKCSWLSNVDFPEWLKPDQVNAIVKHDVINNIPYIIIIEAGEVLQSRVLSWLFQYAINKQINFAWQIEGGLSWLGSPEFNQAMNDLPKGNFLHLTPNRLLPLV